MNEWSKAVARLMEILAILIVGLFFTVYILEPIYEHFGIKFMGNVWVNWFGVSYILFALYTLIAIFLFKNSFICKHRLKSVLFWLTFIAANYVVFVPFVKGENPF
ncbi:hypothetical protein [Oceanobacillus manasiensis]|uniref:hypothetical protein n=1 Tax=Oceanobacillus manasiensis TaxID=586413 RepID=UPI0005A7B1EC|nr:hypothetical protein [Oceanobacillus manasiensis]